MLQVVALRDDVSAARTAKGWTQYRLAHEAGVTPTQVKEIEDGLNWNPRLETLRKLSRALQIPLSHLLGEPAPEAVEASTKEIDGQHAVAVPLRAVNVSAGHGTVFEPPDEPRHYFFRTDFFIRICGRGVPPRDRFITVFLSPAHHLGESMMPTIQPGSLLLIDTYAAREPLEDRGIYLLDLPDGGEDGSLAVKRVTIRKTILVAESDNPDPRYAPVIIDLEEDEIELPRIIKGKVVMWSTEPTPAMPPSKPKNGRG